MSNLLNNETLERLEVAIQTAGSPLLDHLRPGLDATEMDELASKYGFVLPDEARVWWGWKDGSNPAQLRSGQYCIGSVGLRSLESALKASSEMRLIASSSEYEEVKFWEPDWLQFLQTIDSGNRSIDCDLPSGAPSPVRLIDPELGFFDAEFASMRELVEFWIEAIERKFIVFDRETGLWIEGGSWPEIEESGKVMFV